MYNGNIEINSILSLSCTDKKKKQAITSALMLIDLIEGSLLTSLYACASGCVATNKQNGWL